MFIIHNISQINYHRNNGNYSKKVFHKLLNINSYKINLILAGMKSRDMEISLRVNSRSHVENMISLANQYNDPFDQEEVFRLYQYIVGEIALDRRWPSCHGFVPVLAYMRTQEALEEVLDGGKDLKPSYFLFSKWLESQL